MTDPDRMNAKRVEWASTALTVFRTATRCDNDEALRDLLTNLMHWCDAHGVSFENELAVANRAYIEER